MLHPLKGIDLERTIHASSLPGITAALLLLSLSLSLAQTNFPPPATPPTQIDSPIDISLVPVLTPGGDSKFGIYVSIAGSSTPQLYEFDTGGKGFWATYSTETAYRNPSWGSNFIRVPSITVTNTYSSGNRYTGNAVQTYLALYSAKPDGSADSSPSVVSGTNLIIGQTLGITNTKGNISSGSWPSLSPPVDAHFYGDFGLSLAAPKDGIANVLPQLAYSTNVLPGFVVKLRSPGSTDAKLQIGLAADYLADYPIRISMYGRNTNTLFPTINGSTTNGLPTYSETIFTSDITFTNPATGATYTTNTGIVMDSGASPTLHITQAQAAALGSLIVTNGSKLEIDTATLFTILTGQTDSTLIDLFSATTGTDDFKIDVHLTSSQDFNIGADLFYQYDVAYDMQNGIVAFRPVPEITQARLMLAALLGLITFATFRSRRRSSPRITPRH